MMLPSVNPEYLVTAICGGIFFEISTRQKPAQHLTFQMSPRFIEKIELRGFAPIGMLE